VNVVGPRSYEDLRTVNGNVCATYRENLGLLENYAHWDSSLQDASISSFPHRMLYAIEQQYDINELQKFVNLNVPKLNDHQKNVYDTIMQAVQN